MSRLSGKWNSYKAALNTEFYSNISELLDNEMVMDLDNYIHHYSFTRLWHSLTVSHHSFVIARLLHWDSKSAARAGLLHDLFFYNRHDMKFAQESHNKAHPKIALENARKICDLTKREEDIILKHMWLATLRPPRYKEGYIVTFVDKYCAVGELLRSLFYRSRLRTVSGSI